MIWFGNFGLIFGITSGFSTQDYAILAHIWNKISKPLQEMANETVKQKWEKIKSFQQYILNSSRMHFGHPRTITTFKNRNFLKIWVFQGFPYNRLGWDLAILSPFWGKNFKTLAKNAQDMVKNFWKFFYFLKMFQTPPEYILGTLKPLQTIKNH